MIKIIVIIFVILAGDSLWFSFFEYSTAPVSLSIKMADFASSANSTFFSAAYVCKENVHNNTVITLADNSCFIFKPNPPIFIPFIFSNPFPFMQKIPK